MTSTLAERDPPSGQLLPLRIIVRIVEYAVAGQLWRLPELILISKAVRESLLPICYQQLHVHSRDDFDEMIRHQWSPEPSSESIPSVQKYILSIPSAEELVSDRSIYVHYLQTLKDDEDLQFQLIGRMRALSQQKKEETIETIGLRLTGDSTYQPTVAIGLWTCTFFKKLKNLYVDLSTLPPFNQCDPYEGKLYLFDDYDEVPGFLPPGLHKNGTSLESFALSKSYFDDALDFTDRMWPFPEGFIKTLFPKLQRIYLFTFLGRNRKNTGQMHGELVDMARDARQLSHVKLIVNVIVQEGEPAQMVLPSAKVLRHQNGCMEIGPIVVVSMPRPHDSLSLMHRVIDDVNEKWAPENFQGRRWNPSTRPRYIFGPPSKII